MFNYNSFATFPTIILAIKHGHFFLLKCRATKYLDPLRLKLTRVQV